MGLVFFSLNKLTSLMFTHTLRMVSCIFSIESSCTVVGSSCSIDIRDERSGIRNSSLKGLPNTKGHDG